MGCPIRRSRDQRALASTPGFSQRATSFIASRCQGIHQMPLPQRLIAKTRRLQRQAPLATGPRVKTLTKDPGIRHQVSGIRTLNPIPQPKTQTPSSFTESNSSPSAPRRQPKAPSAHSLFTCQRSNTQGPKSPRKLVIPDRCRPLRPLIRRSRGRAPLAPRSRGCSATAVAPRHERRFASFSRWWR